MANFLKIFVILDDRQGFTFCCQVANVIIVLLSNALESTLRFRGLDKENS